MQFLYTCLGYVIIGMAFGFVSVLICNKITQKIDPIGMIVSILFSCTRMCVIFYCINKYVGTDFISASFIAIAIFDVFRAGAGVKERYKPLALEDMSLENMANHESMKTVSMGAFWGSILFLIFYACFAVYQLLF